MKRVAVLLPLFLGLLGLAYFLGQSSVAPQTVEQNQSVWTCSMHPQVRSAEFGDCPICGMDLIEAIDDPGEISGAAVNLSPRELALARVETSPVIRMDMTYAEKAFGRLEVPEPARTSVTTNLAGRIDRLYARSEGETVRAGQPLVDLYSPDALAAQEEFLGATGELREAARTRLVVLGFTPDQVNELEERGSALEVFTLMAPAGGTVLGLPRVVGDWVQRGDLVLELATLGELWLELEVHEAGLPGIKEGLPVQFTLQARPEKTFSGEVIFVSRTLESSRHSALVRVLAPNPDGRLQPGMFARAEIEIPGAGSLVIPASAPLVTGKRAVVYVADGEGGFNPREITLGARADEFYIVAAGLNEGEEVVSRGAFRLDSTLQIEGGQSMMEQEWERP